VIALRAARRHAGNAAPGEAAVAVGCLIIAAQVARMRAHPVMALRGVTLAAMTPPFGLPIFSTRSTRDGPPGNATGVPRRDEDRLSRLGAAAVSGGVAGNRSLDRSRPVKIQAALAGFTRALRSSRMEQGT